MLKGGVSKGMSYLSTGSDFLSEALQSEDIIDGRQR